MRNYQEILATNRKSRPTHKHPSPTSGNQKYTHSFITPLRIPRTQCRQADAALVKLGKQLRSLSKLALKVTAIQPLSACVRHTSAFAPLPHPYAGWAASTSGRVRRLHGAHPGPCAAGRLRYAAICLLNFLSVFSLCVWGGGGGGGGSSPEQDNGLGRMSSTRQDCFAWLDDWRGHWIQSKSILSPCMSSS